MNQHPKAQTTISSEFVVQSTAEVIALLRIIAEQLTEQNMLTKLINQEALARSIIRQEMTEHVERLIKKTDPPIIPPGIDP